METTAKFYPKVKMGAAHKIGEFVIIGLPAKGKEAGELETVIGENAIIRSHSIIYAANTIGDNFQTGHSVVIRENNQIGNNVSIGTGSIIEHHVKIGNNVRMHSQVFIPEFSVIEDESWIGPRVVFVNALHPLCPKVKQCLKGPTIKRGAKIGANATLLPDITIGENVLVGAGSVVVADVVANSVVAGNPARVIKSIDELKCRYRLVEKPYLF